jgi:hypothetical protein
MLKIFAKYGTDEKIAVFCQRNQVSRLQERFEVEFGGKWLLVDECLTGGEILKFQDGQTYKGFEPNQTDSFRYSKAITRFRFNDR